MDSRTSERKRNTSERPRERSRRDRSRSSSRSHRPPHHGCSRRRSISAESDKKISSSERRRRSGSRHRHGRAPSPDRRRYAREYRSRERRRSPREVSRERSRERSTRLDSYRSRNRSRESLRREPSSDRLAEREERRRRERELELEREKERDRLREERAQRDLERQRKQQGERQERELEEASRDDKTVLILNLDLKLSEREVYEFFSEHAGKVRDIQVIRDQRSGRSKGVAYAEFYTQDSVIKALACNGIMIGSQPIGVQASQAEKNRAAKAAKQQQAEVIEGTMRLYVGGLVNVLSSITVADLSELFGAFGEVTDVHLPNDPYTGKAKGFAFVQFRRAADAREALTSMNGFKLADQQLRVGMMMNEEKISNSAEAANSTTIERQMMLLQQQQQLLAGGASLPDPERLDDDDDGGGLLSGATSKLALMQKLQRRAPDATDVVATSTARPAPALSPNLVLGTMFESREVIEAPSKEERDEMVQDILDDVKGECSKYGTVAQIWCDSSSSADGRVWIKFQTVEESVRAAQHLQGRLFGGNPIKAEFVPDSLFLSATSKK